MKRLYLALALLFLTLPAAALTPEEILDDAALQSRAENLYAQVRCVVCQNESIAASEAIIAGDLRRAIREQLLAGKSDEEILGFLVERYGDFVLLKPPFKLETFLLWATAPLLLSIGTFALWRLGRRKKLEAPEPLSADEEARLAQLMKDGQP